VNQWRLRMHKSLIILFAGLIKDVLLVLAQPADRQSEHSERAAEEISGSLMQIGRGSP
jgi:hypothetical protein